LFNLVNELRSRDLAGLKARETIESVRYVGDTGRIWNYLLQLESLGNVIQSTLFGDWVGFDVVVSDEASGMLVEISEPLSITRDDGQSEAWQECEALARL
jgi:hypothetical protein